MTSTTQFTDRPRQDWSRTVRRFLIGLVLIAMVLVAGYFLFVLNWGYSDGDRAGYLQKFSRKGWVCKTYEGELAMTTVPGVAPIIWSFSIWDDETAQKVNALLGRKVVVHYREYRMIPTTCFGETAYFVDRIEPAAE
jgi:hypothetical protein